MTIKLEMNEIETQTFGAHVIETPEGIREKLHAFEMWNRYDLALQLQQKLEEAGKQHLFPQDYTPLEHRQIGSRNEVPARLRVPRKPLANPKHLLVHRRSVVAFLFAEPGHAFTGIAMVGHVTEDSETRRTKTQKITTKKLSGRPKIFLCPVQQGMITTRQSTSKSYVPKKQEAPSFEIYKVKVTGAISHKASDVLEISKTAAQVVDGSMQAHSQLTNIVRMKDKY